MFGIPLRREHTHTLTFFGFAINHVVLVGSFSVPAKIQLVRPTVVVLLMDRLVEAWTRLAVPLLPLSWPTKVNNSQERYVAKWVKLKQVCKRLYVGWLGRTLLATQESKVARLCLHPTKLKRCISSTKPAVKLEFLSHKNLIEGVCYLESAGCRFFVARSTIMLLYMERLTFGCKEILQLWRYHQKLPRAF